MQPIQIIGVKKLDESEIQIINKLASEYYGKIARNFKEEVSLIIHIKTHNITGKRKKYGIHVRVNSPSFFLESTNAVDWDLARTLHKAFNSVEREILHKLHSDTSYKKSYE